MLLKKKIEEGKAELLNKQREKEDLEEKHKIEKKLYMQKIKFLMLKQQDENVELQKDAEIALKQLEDTHRIKEKDFKYDIRSLSKMKKEQEILQNDFINALEKENVRLIHQMKNEFELKEYQLRRFNREKMKEMINNAEEKRRKIIADITDKKTKEIKKITDEHANIFNNMKNYYSELNKKNINALKNLAQFFSTELQNQGNLKSRKLYRYSQLNKINEPYNRLLSENKKQKGVEEKCMENFEILKNKNEEYGSKNLLKNKFNLDLIKQLLNDEYKYEVTLQKLSYLEKEKDSFVNRYKENLHLVEQKAGLRNLILEKKLETIEDNLEIKEVQLRELLRKTSLDPNALSNLNTTLEEVELMKGELINQLEDELKRIKEAHINMIKTYDAKLAEFGIPSEEMGFEPLIPVDLKK